MQDLALEQALMTHARKESWFCSDSRNFQAGDVFVALKGERDDGHRHLAQLPRPALLVIEKGHPMLTTEALAKLAPYCLVENTRSAHRQVAAFFRKRFTGPLIAVGGSNGKTTTKDCLAHLLTKKFRCAVTLKSQNGEEGIPKTLELLRPGVEVGILEIGIDAPGDMQRHCSLVEPTLGLLTSIGEEHLNALHNIETVFAEESLLLRAVQKQGGVTWVPKDDPYLRTLDGESGIRLVPPYQGPISFVNPLALQNLGLAQAVAQHLGMSEGEIGSALQDFRLPPGRGNFLELSQDYWIIADYYNANPSSLEASLEAAISLAQRKGWLLHLILGDMLDLGESATHKHQALQPLLLRSKAQSICLIGTQMSQLKNSVTCSTFPDVEAALGTSKSIFAEPGIYLIKGSRGMRLEKLVKKALEDRQIPLEGAWKKELLG